MDLQAKYANDFTVLNEQWKKSVQKRSDIELQNDYCLRIFDCYMKKERCTEDIRELLEGSLGAKVPILAHICLQNLPCQEGERETEYKAGKVNLKWCKGRTKKVKKDGRIVREREGRAYRYAKYNAQNPSRFQRAAEKEIERIWRSRQKRIQSASPLELQKIEDSVDEIKKNIVRTGEEVESFHRRKAREEDDEDDDYDEDDDDDDDDDDDEDDDYDEDDDDEDDDYEDLNKRLAALKGSPEDYDEDYDEDENDDLNKRLAAVKDLPGLVRRIEEDPDTPVQVKAERLGRLLEVANYQQEQKNTSRRVLLHTTEVVS